MRSSQRPGRRSFGAAQSVTTAPVSGMSQPILRQDWSFVLGLTCLFLGILFYYCARPSTVAQFVPTGTDLSRLLPHRLRVLLGPVPTFIHVTAFSLMTSSVLGRTRNLRLGICASWVAVEILFECAQHPTFSSWLFMHCPLLFSLPDFRAYVLTGTFDWIDIMAAILGGVFTAMLLTRVHWRTHESREQVR